MREAASRLQQKIQKHLLDSEDGKVLDHTGDKTASIEYQVKTHLEKTSVAIPLSFGTF